MGNFFKKTPTEKFDEILITTLKQKNVQHISEVLINVHSFQRPLRTSTTSTPHRLASFSRSTSTYLGVYWRIRQSRYSYSYKTNMTLIAKLISMRVLRHL